MPLKSSRRSRKISKRKSRTARRSTKKRSTKRRSYRFSKRRTTTKRSKKSVRSKGCRSQSKGRAMIIAYYDGPAPSYGTIPHCFYKIKTQSLSRGKFSKVDSFAGPDKMPKTDANIEAFIKKKAKAMAHIRSALRRSGKRSSHVQST